MKFGSDLLICGKNNPFNCGKLSCLFFLFINLSYSLTSSVLNPTCVKLFICCPGTSEREETRNRDNNNERDLLPLHPDYCYQESLFIK